MRRQVYGLATAITLISTGAMATDIAAMSPQERTAFGAEVRGFLLENPEVIEEAQKVLEERRAQAERERDAQLVADQLEPLYGDEMSPMIGDPDAPFTVVKFNDFNCGHCRAVEPDLAAFIEQNPDYKLIIKEFPVLGDGSVAAARVSIAVKMLAPEKSAEFFDALCGTCHGSISGRPIDTGLKPDFVTSASATIAASKPPFPLNKAPSERGPIEGAKTAP